MKILIVALRRSGSTIFWECFRKATKSTCFDEPFNPWLIKLPQEHTKKNCQEYITYLNKYPEKFWNLFSPISPIEELKSDFTQHQALYLQDLLQQDDNVVIDTTRCWNKIAELRDICPSDTFLIYLHRAPASFVTSHLLPSDDTKRLSSFLLKWKRQRSFWTRKNDYNKWNLEEILGKDVLSAFHLLMLKDKNLAEKFYQAPAAYRLLKFWSIVYEKVEEEGRNVFGDQFVSVRFEDFCNDPNSVLSLISNMTGLSFDYSKLPKIQAPKKPFMSDSQSWELAFNYWKLAGC